MNEGEQDHAYSLYLYQHMFVLLHALHLARIACVYATGHPNAGAPFEIRFAVDLTPFGVVCGKQFQKSYLTLRYGLNPVSLDITIYSEGRKRGRLPLALCLQRKCL